MQMQMSASIGIFLLRHMFATLLFDLTYRFHGKHLPPAFLYQAQMQLRVQQTFVFLVGHPTCQRCCFHRLRMTLISPPLSLHLRSPAH